MAEITTDKRIDDLRVETHRGFAQVDQRFDRVEGEMHRGFERADKRIDDLREEMHRGFERTDGRIDDLREEMHHGLAHVDQRFGRVETDIRELRVDTKAGFDSLQKLMIRFFAGTLGSIFAGVALLFLSHH